MVDKFQTEATRTLRAAGFVPIKLADFHFNSDGKKQYPNKGRPDSFFAGRDGRGGFLEVKTARGVQRRRFDFKEWRDEQRAWYYREALPYRASFWLFIVFGDTISDKQYPRIALMVTAARLLEIEQQTNKKSLSYEEALKLDDGQWLLSWAGSGIWDVPATHPFYRKHIQQEKIHERLPRGFRRFSRSRLSPSRRRSAKKHGSSPNEQRPDGGDAAQ